MSASAIGHRQKSVRPCQSEIPYRGKISNRWENGSGKSTFIKLLCRLYDPTEGEILLNGINIKKYKYKEYMSVFSVVFQDFKLFALPLGQNVAASTEYDADKVQECLKLAGFDVHSDRMKRGWTPGFTRIVMLTV